MPRFEQHASHIVRKPWGHEEWLAINHAYAYKRIHIRAGHRTSFQYHRKKIETNYVVSGELELWLEDEHGQIRTWHLKPGEHFTVQPGRKHRLSALSDAILQEVSSPEVDDVVRLEDDTARGNGRIDAEHEQNSP